MYPLRPFGRRKAERAAIRLLFLLGDPAGTRTPDLRLKRAVSIVIQRFATCEKVAILAAFSCFAFCSVLQNNSTFCNGVEFLLNYFSVYYRVVFNSRAGAVARCNPLGLFWFMKYYLYFSSVLFLCSAFLCISASRVRARI